MFHDLTVCLSFFELFLTQWIIAILSKRCKPDNFQSHNSLKRSFTNIIIIIVIVVIIIIIIIIVIIIIIIIIIINIYSGSVYKYNGSSPRKLKKYK